MRWLAHARSCDSVVFERASISRTTQKPKHLSLMSINLVSNGDNFQPMTTPVRTHYADKLKVDAVACHRHLDRLTSEEQKQQWKKKFEKRIDCHLGSGVTLAAAKRSYRSINASIGR
jgi:hypothetical protein